MRYNFSDGSHDGPRREHAENHRGQECADSGDQENVAQNRLNGAAGGVYALQAAENVAIPKVDTLHGQRNISFTTQANLAFRLRFASIESRSNFRKWDAGNTGLEDLAVAR